MITSLPPDPTLLFKRKVAWYVQEVRREGHVLDVFVMSSWDNATTPRVYVQMDGTPALAAGHWQASARHILSREEICTAECVSPPADYVIGDRPRGRITKCMWCGDSFPSEDEVIQHEDQCDVA